ncbi:MAG: phosphate acyltransferase PlsX [Halanaerobiales bacterium]
MNIAVDVMGGDNAPGAIIEGAASAAREFNNIKLILIGQQDLITEELNKYNPICKKMEVVNADQVIGMHEAPSRALRKKKKSSIYIGSKMVKDKQADAFISAGNTGAVMASGLLNIGRLPGIKRPSIATIFPSESGKTLVLDSGANVDSKPENLLQFSLMGQLYAQRLLGKKNPRIGLLSIGEEKKKGNQLTSSTYELMENEARITNFIGNVEGRDIFNGTCDIIICDGFIGNIVLKTTEGVASFLLDLFKDAFTENILTKIGTFLLKSQLEDIKKTVDYRHYGGAPLLGVKGVVIISHGNSDAIAIHNAISVAQQTIEKEVVKDIEVIINREGELND